MYKAKCNNFCKGKIFEAGKEYTAKQIEGLDVNDFELIDVKAPKVVKPKSMTNASLKAKK